MVEDTVSAGRLARIQRRPHGGGKQLGRPRAQTAEDPALDGAAEIRERWQRGLNEAEARGVETDHQHL